MEPKKKGRLKDTIIQLLSSAAIMGLLSAFCLWIYNSYLVTPKLVYVPSNSTDTFSVEDGFNGISMRLRPQMLIRYKNNIVLCVYLKGYYEQEYLPFTDSSVTYTKSRQQYCDELQIYTKRKIIEQLQIQLGDKPANDIESNLEVFISIVGGISYNNKQGNQLKKHCVIEQNKIFLEYGYNSTEIEDRLYDREFQLGNDPKLIETNPDVQIMVQAVVEEIGRIYGNH